MASDTRKAGWVSFGSGLLSILGGVLLDEPALVGTGAALTVGGAAAAAGYDAPTSLAVGAAAGVVVGGVTSALSGDSGGAAQTTTTGDKVAGSTPTHEGGAIPAGIIAIGIGAAAWAGGLFG